MSLKHYAMLSSALAIFGDQHSVIYYICYLQGKYLPQIYYFNNVTLSHYLTSSDFQVQVQSVQL